MTAVREAGRDRLNARSWPLEVRDRESVCAGQRVHFISSRTQLRCKLTLCPIALVVTCVRCPMLSICPLKGLIGNLDVAPKVNPKNAKKTWPK